jgi:hypothetical protein
VAWSPVGEFADVIALGSKVCVVVVVFVACRLSFWNGLTVNNHHVTSTLSLSLTNRKREGSDSTTTEVNSNYSISQHRPLLHYWDLSRLLLDLVVLLGVVVVPVVAVLSQEECWMG